MLVVIIMPIKRNVIAVTWCEACNVGLSFPTIENKRLYMWLSYLYLITLQELPCQTTHPSLLLEPAGNVGSVGRGIVKLLRERDLQVRALVHRLDERSRVERDGSRTCRRRPHKWC